MTLRIDDYEIGAFFALVVIFEICERFRPARPINRWVDFKIDLLSFAFALAVNRLLTYSGRHLFGLTTPVVVGDSLRALQALPGGLKILLAIFVVDFILYWIHRAQHRTNALWRTHAWHHSVEQLYWLSGFRTSFLHSFLYNIPQAAVPILIFQLSPAEAGIGYSIGLLIQFWEHTNFNVNVGPLAWLIVTPDYHRIHHSATEHCGKNLGTTFRIWDRLFGTYVDPASVPASFRLGLGEEIDKKKIPRMLLGV